MRTLAWSLCLLVWVTAVSAQTTDEATKALIEKQYAALYPKLYQAVDPQAIRATIQKLSSYPSRVTGYPGSDQAAAYIEAQFKAIGLSEVVRETYQATVPIDRNSELTVGGSRFRVYALWPNLVRTSQLPPGGLSAPIIYAGDSKLARYNGKAVRDSIVLVDFNSGSEWLNAPRLGAKAVIFIEPDTTMRGQGEGKFVGIPLSIPRFWISKADAAQVLPSIMGQREVKANLTCDMPWEKRTASNVAGWIEGTDPKLKNQYIILESYMDSMSVVPALSPGAESACGAAGLLELAKVFKKYPPKRTVLFLATSGHFLGLSGIRNWMETHFDQLRQLGTGEKFKAWLSDRMPSVFHAQKRDPWDIYLFASLDLSSQSRSVGIFYKGVFYDYREDIQSRFSDIARICRENAEKVGNALNFDSKKAFADGVNPVDGKNWRNYLPGKFAFENEPVTMAGGHGVAFTSIDDSRSLVDTPFDTFEHVNIANVTRQTKLLACLMAHILNDPNDPSIINQPKMPIAEPGKFSRMGLQGGFARLQGKIVWFNPKKSFIPNDPVPHGLAIIQSGNKSYMGVRGNMVEMVNEKGEFVFPGVAPLTAYGWNKPTSLQAYALDSRTGEIVYAPDLGVNGAKAYPLEQQITIGVKDVLLVVFRCVSTSIYDLVDPQGLRTLVQMNVYDGASNGEPRMYGMVLSRPEWYVSYVEDTAVVFSEPGRPEAPTRIKVIMGAGPAATRFVLINSTPKNPEGEGYPVGSGGAIANTSLRVAEDMWNMDEFRINRLAKYRIINEGINKLHADAKRELDLARDSLAKRDYATFDAHARAAWGYESRAYPDVQKTAQDVVRGVLFYMFLMLPFAYFTERLFFGFSDLKRQILVAFGIFGAVFIIFKYVHPAFDITMNPLIVLEAFIMLSLSILVIVLVAGKFEEQLKQLNRQISGVHRADIGRMSIAAAAFSLGISNMRKRKARTFLTCTTLILLTFTVLSFTSIVNVMRFNKVPSPGLPRYNGIMLRTAMWEPLQEPAYRLLKDEFGDTRAVAPRAWFFGSSLGEQSFLTLRRADKAFDAKAAVGLTPDEARVTHPDKALLAGRWFEATDVYAMILPEAIAAGLNIKPEDVGKAKVNFSGVDYTVIGLIANAKFKEIKDLDREPLTPVDFILMQKLTRQGKSMGEAGFREYTHLEPDNAFFIPYRTIMNLGAEIRSIAIDFVTPEEVKNVLQNLMPRLGLNLYAGTEEEGEKRIYRYSSIGGTSTRGVETVFIPILIAALIVLNTMLGSVFERVREIHIFSSIGLAPSHVAMLFIAESMVYAIMGAVAGYLLGQLVARVITLLNVLPGLYLNFSSMSAVLSTIVVVATVLLSTVYPARKASEVATPAIDRSWRVPDPVGDEWTITLPFAVTGDQATGLNGFLSEWFQAYEEYSIGDFVTQDVQTSEFDTQYGKAYRISLMAWLAPFDLGVSQQVALETIPTDMEDVYELQLVIHRQSGDISNWKRVNRRFLNTLRKQFLIWRTLKTDERNRYLVAAAPAGESGMAPQPAMGGGD
ncbi:MAG: FtsX-like permease family protein [Armatimonadetes bacterium]|nr:FtsX-like permease family protein [Armatimonadota bacterium]